VCLECGAYRSGCSAGRTGSMSYFAWKGGPLIGHRAPVCDIGFKTKCVYGTSKETTMATCSCKDGCNTLEQMRSRHGDPMAFAAGVWDAHDTLMITPNEAEAAIAKYEREWAEVAKNVTQSCARSD
jgi:hypothetical protein